MNYLLLLMISVCISCSKGNHTGKSMDYTPRFGANDPCSETERCLYVEYLSLNDPLVQKKVHKYFPGYEINQPTLYLYKVGQKYQLAKQGIFNQSYDFETNTYKKGCKISYQESRTIYRITKGLIDDEGEKYSEILYKYKKENPKNLTASTECEEYLADSYEFNDDAEDWESEDIYIPQEGIDSKSNDLMIHFFVIRLDGQYFLRRVLETKNQTVSVTLFNPDTRRLEEVNLILDIYSITISHPDNNSLGNKYEFSEVYTDGILTQESSVNLSQVDIVNIDTSDIPEDY
jgi:hypothetical protein